MLLIKIDIFSAQRFNSSWVIVWLIDSRLIDELSASNLQQKYVQPDSGKRSSGFNQTSRNGGSARTGNGVSARTGNGGLMKTGNGNRSFENFNRGQMYSQSPTIIANGGDSSLVRLNWSQVVKTICELLNYSGHHLKGKWIRGSIS